MSKALAGVIVGAIVYFIWGFISWAVIPWHTATVKALPQQRLLSDTMKVVIKEPGFYVFPAEENRNDKDERDKVNELFRQGPVGTVAFSPTGHERMGADILIKQFVSDLVQAALVMFVLFAASHRFKSVVHRAHLAAALGLLIGIAAHVQNRLWFNFPMGYTIVNILDLTVGYALLGIALAKFVPEGA